MIHLLSTKKEKLILAVLLGCVIFGVGFNPSCGRKLATPLIEKPQQNRGTPSETPVALQPTKENKGRRCDAINYTLSGDKSDDAIRECYKLQQRLEKAAEVGNLSEIREALRLGANPDGSSYPS